MRLLPGSSGTSTLVSPAEGSARALPGVDFDPPYTTVGIGRIDGGTIVNIVPRDCRLSWELRPLPGVDAEAIYARALAKAAGVGRWPTDPASSVWQSFPVALPSAAAAEAFIAAAAACGIEVRRYYHPALSRIPGVRARACPVAESLAERVCGFPVYGQRTPEEQATLLGGLEHALLAAAKAR